jgi:hypothetical protein
MTELEGPGGRWAASGGAWLTGQPDGLALGAPCSVVTVLEDRAGAFGVDGPALLGERAAFAGLTRHGRISCGSTTRLLGAGDGWVAVALPRRDDVALLPAWIGIAPTSDPWPALARAVADRAGDDVVASGTLLGLAVARLGERAVDGEAVVATPLGAAEPMTRWKGRRVVDLSSLWAGPLCGQLLAAVGMEVVKVESTRRPDGARHGPPAFFDLMNATKASVSLDLSDHEDREALGRLLRSADVVIEASRPRALEQLGVDAAEMVTTGAVQVWVSITGHGRSGAHGQRVAFGDDAAVAGGLVAWDHDGPVFCADAAADPATGLLAASAVLERLAVGGRWLLDVALARAAALMASGPLVDAIGPVRPPRARAAPGRAPAMGRDTRRIIDALRARR